MAKQNVDRPRTPKMFGKPMKPAPLSDRHWTMYHFGLAASVEIGPGAGYLGKLWRGGTVFYTTEPHATPQKAASKLARTLIWLHDAAREYMR